MPLLPLPVGTTIEAMVLRVIGADLPVAALLRPSLMWAVLLRAAVFSVAIAVRHIRWWRTGSSG